MLSNHGDIVMQILSKRQVKELVLYSLQHIARLEKAGQFARRVLLGPNRVGWIGLKCAWRSEKTQTDTPDFRSWVTGVANSVTRPKKLWRTLAMS